MRDALGRLGTRCGAPGRRCRRPCGPRSEMSWTDTVSSEARSLDTAHHPVDLQCPLLDLGRLPGQVAGQPPAAPGCAWSAACISRCWLACRSPWVSCAATPAACTSRRFSASACSAKCHMARIPPISRSNMPTWYATWPTTGPVVAHLHGVAAAEDLARQFQAQHQVVDEGADDRQRQGRPALVERDEHQDDVQVEVRLEPSAGQFDRHIRAGDQACTGQVALETRRCRRGRPQGEGERDQWQQQCLGQRARPDHPDQQQHRDVQVQQGAVDPVPLCEFSGRQGRALGQTLEQAGHGRPIGTAGVTPESAAEHAYGGRARQGSLTADEHFVPALAVLPVVRRLRGCPSWVTGPASGREAVRDRGHHRAALLQRAGPRAGRARADHRRDGRLRPGLRDPRDRRRQHGRHPRRAARGRDPDAEPGGARVPPQRRLRHRPPDRHPARPAARSSSGPTRT